MGTRDDLRTVMKGNSEIRGKDLLGEIGKGNRRRDESREEISLSRERVFLFPCPCPEHRRRGEDGYLCGDCDVGALPEGQLHCHGEGALSRRSVFCHGSEQVEGTVHAGEVNFR